VSVNICFCMKFVNLMCGGEGGEGVSFVPCISITVVGRSRYVADIALAVGRSVPGFACRIGSATVHMSRCLSYDVRMTFIH